MPLESLLAVQSSAVHGQPPISSADDAHVRLLSLVLGRAAWSLESAR